MQNQPPKDKKLRKPIGFPWIKISQLALAESWRKEISRPPLHLHPWWAVRLGSVFRGILLSSLGTDLSEKDLLLEKVDFSDKVVLDPFMGSGTTLLEALKIGARAIGVDINPVAVFAAKQALSFVDEKTLLDAFSLLEATVGAEIQRYYTTLDPETRRPIPVLYTFWVKTVRTPEGEEIPLFKSFIFAKHAYPQKNPKAQAICPSCWGIVPTRYDATEAVCPRCNHHFNPQKGYLKARGKVQSASGVEYRVVDLLPNGRPPDHRMYALLALRENGQKVYLPVGEHDVLLYEAASERLSREGHALPLPQGAVLPGVNTDQALRYGYLYWRDFFNDRQLLTLGLLLQGILNLREAKVRNAFLALFSAVLDFNNMFCTYKGEGTGAVRPLFSHHILKPEYTPLENSVWGIPESSGTFVSLFRRKLLPAKRYLASPYERLPDGKKVFVAATPLKATFGNVEEVLRGQAQVALLYGDSSKLPLPDSSVDAIVTDPPYGDFVNYSELADFFYSWLSLALSREEVAFTRNTSRNEGEVQDKDLERFGLKLTQVFSEASRVLKENGTLAFTFHHSRFEAWVALAKSLLGSRFVLESVYPVYGELSRSKVKGQSKKPIHFDIVLFCRKESRLGADEQESIIVDILGVFSNLNKFAAENKINLSEGDFSVIRHAFALLLSFNKSEAIRLFNLCREKILSALRNASEGKLQWAKSDIHDATLIAEILKDTEKLLLQIGIQVSWNTRCLDGPLKRAMESISKKELSTHA